VLVANTLRALAGEGHELTLVSPLDPASQDREHLVAKLREFCQPHLVSASPKSAARAFLRSRRDGVPISISRHSLPAVSRAVAQLVTGRRFDVVHAEQLQALPQCNPARQHALPIVLRSQNVETDLWSGRATVWPVCRRLARHESRRLARYEGHAVRTAAATIALTARDADRLRELSDANGVIHHVPAPFPDWLPPGPDRVSGAPAVVILGGGWFPNRDGAVSFVTKIWSDVQAQCPRAVLHLFGQGPRIGRPRGLVVHPPPADSRTAFPPGAILAVPLRIASGVRVKILEAWARGLPVVATPEAAAGLEARDGRELLIAHDAPGFAAAIRRLHEEPAFASASVEAGRALLRAHHDPRRIASRLAEVYAGVPSPSREVRRL
jgi:hypothetical protein